MPKITKICLSLSKIYQKYRRLFFQTRCNVLVVGAFLFSSGHLDITMALQMSEYLVDETEYVPWQIGLEALQYISGLLEGHPDFMYFKVNTCTFLLL